MKKALLVIDYTNDFVADHGALTCGKPGQAIEQTIASLTEQFIQEDELVVFACDLHEINDSYHPESKLFPPHNIRDTDGRELFGSLQILYKENQHLSNVRWMDKTRYSSFAGTNLEQLLGERGICEIHLVGVCTDICVLHTAVDAYNKGIQTFVYEKGVASFDEKGHEWALNHFKNTLGAKVIL
ncbi:cysteine hydrolase [Viridibacillus sp. YIM B01967]|uniref:Cysteine hydrolase n=1 Tax=Viridibacillus soli TaxID=2798301 RepID=A0ABS1H882_9BACL|nr:isochorismatase family cysteine hydrolase [Viridibacillus soli]MBK3495228.1 cysteine hydrolase [Viridibacillus soli]